MIWISIKMVTCICIAHQIQNVTSRSFRTYPKLKQLCKGRLCKKNQNNGEKCKIREREDHSTMLVYYYVTNAAWHHGIMSMSRWMWQEQDNGRAVIPELSRPGGILGSNEPASHQPELSPVWNQFPVLITGIISSPVHTGDGDTDECPRRFHNHWRARDFFGWKHLLAHSCFDAKRVLTHGKWSWLAKILTLGHRLLSVLIVLIATLHKEKAWVIDLQSSRRFVSSSSPHWHTGTRSKEPATSSSSKQIWETTTIFP